MLDSSRRTHRAQDDNGAGRSGDLALGLASTPADAQLASRPAAEWKATLEAPARVEGLKIEQVVKALKLKDGDVVADLGAGTGLFEPQLAYAIGTRGRVYAVEIDKGFLDEIDRKVDELHISIDRDRPRHAHRSDAADRATSTLR